jgi:bifunctional enzyme CysN/CysC
MNVHEYLNTHEKKDLLRLLTCGSVDDGKSTLIGRLLYDSKLIFEDQLSALRRDSEKNGTTGVGEIDYALLLDGLKAEREQGITIDVAYRYFSTPKRKFIIADCPGHEQYTRNMATGASTADLAIILIDARYGVITQTRRHAFIVSLLGIRHVVVAVNKMDLVDYSEEVFDKISSDFRAFAENELDLANLHFVPLSALKGENVVERSARTPYYTGKPLLELLETVDIRNTRNFDDFRFVVQHVIRPNLDFRGFAGTVASGVVRTGDRVRVLPSGKESRVKAIVTADGNLDYAFSPQAVTLTLEDEIDISRGDLIAHPDNLPTVADRFEAHLIWMTAEELTPGRSYLLRHGGVYGKAKVREIVHQIDVNTLERLPAAKLPLNAIAKVVVETTVPIFFDPYRKNRMTGRFVLVDPVTNATAGAGLIIRAAAKPGERSRLENWQTGGVTPRDRAARQRHTGRGIVLVGKAAGELAARLEEKLFQLSLNSYTLSLPGGEEQPEEKLAELREIGRAFVDAGFLFISAFERLSPEELAYLADWKPLVVAGAPGVPGAQLTLEPAAGGEAQLEAITRLLVAERVLPDYYSAGDYAI